MEEEKANFLPISCQFLANLLAILCKLCTELATGTPNCSSERSPNTLRQRTVHWLRPAACKCPCELCHDLPAGRARSSGCAS